MTDQVQSIERARKRREDELVLLLLALADEARRDAVVLMKHDQDVQQGLRNDFAEAETIIADRMAQAHRDAYQRLGRWHGNVTRDDAGSVETLSKLYRPQARQAADAMAATLWSALLEAEKDLTLNTPKKIVNAAFDAAGYTKASAAALDAGAERAIVVASNIGMIAAAQQHGGVTGLSHHSVVDDATTDICLERDGLSLPANHPYWKFNIPQLHWRCRSVVLPIVGPFEPSQSLPTIPPQPGFGVAPAGFLEAFIQRRAA